MQTLKLMTNQVNLINPALRQTQYISRITNHYFSYLTLVITDDTYFCFGV